jgi:predicted NBD/HSP70 family sugar kinase
VTIDRGPITSTTDVSRWNAELVLECLSDRQAYPIAALARVTGLSRSTVERILDLLADRDVVDKSDPVGPVIGRPAALYRLRGEFGYLVALDVGANTVRARVDDFAGPVLGQNSYPAAGAVPEPAVVRPRDPADHRLTTLDALVDQALAAAGVTEDQVRAVTVGTPGIVDGDGVIISCKVIKSEGWVGDRLRTRLRDRFPAAVVAVDNDANLAVRAEQRFCVSGNIDDMVVVLAGRRVGFGIVVRGDLHRGAHHQAGEAANIKDSSWGKASLWLYRHANQAPALFAQAKAGKPAAVALVREFAKLLGVAMAEIVHTIDSHLIVLGGAVSLAGATVLDPVSEQFKRSCSGMETPELALSTLGRDAVLLGAAEQSRRNAFAHLLSDMSPLLSNGTPRRRQ